MATDSARSERSGARKPSRNSILLLIFGAVVVTSVFFGFVVWGERALTLLTSSLAEGNLSSLLTFVTQDSNMTVIAGALIVLILLLFLGVYIDMARRTGFPVNSRIRLLVSPMLFSVVVLTSVIPIGLLVILPLISLEISVLLMMLIPAGIAIFALLVVVGALPLWILHRKDASFVRAMLLSARLLLAPLIDAFWSVVTVFVSLLIATPIFAIALFVNTYLVFNTASEALSAAPDILTGISNALIGAGTYALSPTALLIFAVPFCIFGLLIAWGVFKDGPSLTMSAYCALMGVVLAVATGIAILYAYYLLAFNPVGFVLFVHPFFLLVWGILLFGICALVFIVFFVAHWLLMWLGIGGVFGLFIVILSSLFLALFFGALPNIPFIGQLIMDLIPFWVEAIALEIGVLGIVVGILVAIVTFHSRAVSIIEGDTTGEAGQVFSHAMAVSIGASTVLPFLLVSVLHLPGLVGGLIGSLLVFLFISPIYMLTVNLLRIVRALKALWAPTPKEGEQDKRLHPKPADYVI